MYVKSKKKVFKMKEDKTDRLGGPQQLSDEEVPTYGPVKRFFRFIFYPLLYLLN